MVRNLNMVKGAPCCPLLFCRKMAGPVDSRRMAAQMAMKRGERSASKSALASRSKMSLQIYCQAPAWVGRKTRRFWERISSKWAWAIFAPTNWVLSQASTPSSSQAWMAWDDQGRFCDSTSKRTMPADSSWRAWIKSGKEVRAGSSCRAMRMPEPDSAKRSGQRR